MRRQAEISVSCLLHRERVTSRLILSGRMRFAMMPLASEAACMNKQQRELYLVHILRRNHSLIVNTQGSLLMSQLRCNNHLLKTASLRKDNDAGQKKKYNYLDLILHVVLDKRQIGFANVQCTIVWAWLWAKHHHHYYYYYKRPTAVGGAGPLHIIMAPAEIRRMAVLA